MPDKCNCEFGTEFKKFPHSHRTNPCPNESMAGFSKCMECWHLIDEALDDLRGELKPKPRRNDQP
jgi:hypothetical protein